MVPTSKAKQKNKLVIDVQPQYTSQECSRCGHIHEDNRLEQAVFECQNCGFTANADTNAAIVVKWRGIRSLRNGELTVKQKKNTMRLKKKGSPGQELAKVMHGEKDVRHAVGVACGAQPSVNRETPTTIVPTI